MSYSVQPWSNDVVKEYLTATSQQKSDPEKFYRTHLDIDRIYAEFLGAKQSTFVTQEDLRDELLSGRIDEDIRTYILRGETGSGKSQLCQWLDYELQGIGEATDVDERIPLHIKASETSLEQIISTLAEPLGIDPEIAQVQDLEAEPVADAIIGMLAANPGQKLKDANIHKIINEGGLKSILVENIERYQRGLDEEDETEFDPNLISQEDYRQIRLKLGTDSVFHKNQGVLRQALRDEIHRHFSHVLDVEDFQGQLREYVETYISELGKRPVIICEDVTTFSVLKEQLLDQIIQVESSSFDIVLGYTTGFEQDDLEDALGDRGSQDALTYLQDRSEGYLSLTDEGVAYFLNDSLAVDLVQKYLNVIKEDSGAALDDELEAAFDQIYPFNRATLKLVYERLLEKGSPRRTPRVLLQKVIRRCLLSDKPPYEVIDENPNVDSLVTPISPTAYSHEIQTLTTWYGYRKSSEEESAPILVHTGVLDAFGIDHSVGEGTFTDEETDEVYVEFHPNTQVAAVLGGDQARPALDEEVSDGDRSDDHKEDDEKEKKKERKQPKNPPSDPPIDDDDDEEKGRAESRIKQFLEWAKTGGEYESSEVLKSGAEDILEMWHDPTRLANPNATTRGTNGIYYTHGQNVPVSIQGPNERDGISVMIEFGMEDYDLKFDLLNVGLHDDIPDDVNLERLNAWATNSVVGLRGDIRENVEKCLPEELSIEHCIVLAKFLLSNAEFGETELNRELLFDESTPKEARDYADPLVKLFGRTDSLVESLGEIQTRRTDIEKLMEGFFLLKNNLVDHDRLRDVQRDIANNPVTYLGAAQQIDTEKLEYPEWYKIGSNRGNANTKVTTFLDAISDYAVELELLTDDMLREEFEEALEPVQRWHDASHTVDSLEEQFATLQSALGTFGEKNEASWDEAADALDENTLKLTAFNEVLPKFADPNTSNAFDRIALLHEFQRSQESHDAWKVYKAFDEMITRLNDYEVDDEGDLRRQIEELSVLDQYEQERAAVIEATEEY